MRAVGFSLPAVGCRLPAAGCGLPADVRGLVTSYVLCPVLRALPAVTKVDGLVAGVKFPAASQILYMTCREAYFQTWIQA